MMVELIPKGVTRSHGLHNTFIIGDDVMERVVIGLLFHISDLVNGLYGLIGYFYFVGRHEITISLIVTWVWDDPRVVVTFGNDSRNHIDIGHVHNIWWW